MKRRFFIQGGSAAVAAALTGCGGGGSDVAAADEAGLDSLEAARKKPRPIPTDPPTAPIPTDPIPAPPANTIYTYQQEFDDPSAPLLHANGGPFYPYFAYYGGNAQPDGPNGYRWWNDEQQVYTTSNYTPAPYNPFSVSNSVLSITAKPTPAAYVNAPKPYLSGCLETSKGGWWDSADVRDARGGFEQKYGYWEARVRIPKGKGVWGAFWLTGGITPTSNGKGGELDIFETIGDGKIYQTVHDWWTSTPHDYYAYAPSWDYAADFHTYGLLWTPDSIIWYVDGVETRRASAAMVARYRDQCGPMYLVFNLALGGSWPGNPDSTTPFPSAMDIDYVRVRAV